jgi:hypothetical protein
MAHSPNRLLNHFLEVASRGKNRRGASTNQHPQVFSRKGLSQVVADCGKSWISAFDLNKLDFAFLQAEARFQIQFAPVLRFRLDVPNPDTTALPPG